MSHVLPMNTSFSLLLSLSLTLLSFAMCEAGDPISRTVTGYALRRCEVSQPVTLRTKFQDLLAQLLDLSGYPVDLPTYVKQLKGKGFRSTIDLNDLPLPLDGEEVAAKFGNKRGIVKFKWVVLDLRKVESGQSVESKTVLYKGPLEIFRFESCKNGKEETVSFLGTSHESRFPIYPDGSAWTGMIVDNTEYSSDAKLLMLQKVAEIYCDEEVKGQHKFVYKKRFYLAVYTPLTFRRTVIKQLDKKKENRTGK